MVIARAMTTENPSPVHHRDIRRLQNHCLSLNSLHPLVAKAKVRAGLHRDQSKP